MEIDDEWSNNQKRKCNHIVNHKVSNDLTPANERLEGSDLGELV